MNDDADMIQGHEEVAPEKEPAVASSAEELEDEQFAIQRLEEEVQEFRGKYLRTLAEMENMHKRLLKEKQDALRFAREKVLAEMLGPMDNLENALKCAGNMSTEVRNWALGFEMILSQFKDVLSNHGITSFVSVGQRFDPHLHEAVEVAETDEHLEGTILAQFAPGYRSSMHIVRPARVKVAKPVLQEKEE